MRKLIIGLVGAVCAIVVGCKTVPSVETMTSVSTAIGYSAGLVANMTKIDDESRNAICEIVGIVQETVPQTNETFETAWMPIAKAHTQKLVDEGKITAAQGQLIIAGFKVAVMGLDYIFEVRFPQAKQYKELVMAAIHGFSDGFLTVFKPVNLLSAAKDGKQLMFDMEAYEYLRLKTGK